MISRSSLGRSARLAQKLQCCSHPVNRRGLAAPASGSFQYETGDAGGVKLASRDLSGPTTSLAMVAKAGTRYQILPGMADALEKFAYKVCSEDSGLRRGRRRTALRITRETELLGGELSAYHSRENMVIGAKFLRDDLPYFVELLGEVATQTKYTSWEWNEDVIPNIHLAQKKLLGSTGQLAINSAHGVAFHRGLGTPLHPSSSSALSKYLHDDYVADYAKAAYSKPNIAIVANGATNTELSKWVGEFFGAAPSAPPSDVPKLESPPTKYYGGEERIAHASGNTMILAFPGSSSSTGGSYKPEIAVLAALLGGQSSIKWAPGFSLLSKSSSSYIGAHVSTTYKEYSDAGLLYITIEGSPKDVRGASGEAVKALKSVAEGKTSKEDIKKAVALAKFRALENGQDIHAGLELTGAGLIEGGKAFQIDEVGKAIDGVSEEQVKKIAKTLIDGRATVSTVGDLYALPYAADIGLHV
ncbi:MAG: ubiquinol-cytochrome c reductase core subunit 1 [Pycnora praestabilis]|nr:MAG: ubiquinol-cytochrome c reductase core subunit 1 [Pycnora praestabilis]